MTSGGQRAARSCRGRADRGRSRPSGWPPRRPAASRASSARRVDDTAGRSGARGRIGAARDRVVRASRRPWLRPRPRRRSAVPGGDREAHLVGPGSRRRLGDPGRRPAAATGCGAGALDRSRRSSASRASPSRDFAPSRRPDRDTTMSRRRRVAHDGQSARPWLRPAPCARTRGPRGRAGRGRVVGHDRVGDEGPHAERLDGRGERRIHRVEHEPVDEPGVQRGRRRARVDSWPSDDEHPVGRALERLPADDRRSPPRPARRRRRAAASRSRIAGTARIGPIETIGFDGAMTIASAALERGRTSGVASAASMPSKRTSWTVGRLLAMDEVLLELEPAVVGPDLGPHRLVGHRQDRGRRCRGPAGARGDLGQPVAGAQPRRPHDVRREVPVAEPEPRLLAVALEHRAGRRSRRGCPSRAASSRPASVYMTVSWSGQTSRPWRSRSSPVLTTTVGSSPTAAWRPCGELRAADAAGQHDDPLGSGPDRDVARPPGPPACARSSRGRTAPASGR